MDGRAEYCRDFCKQSYAKKNAPCPCESGEDCENKKPDLLGDTQEIIDLFIMCGTQWRVGFGGPVGIDYSAVFSAAGVLGMEVTPALFKKIRSLESYELDCMASKRKGG